LLLHAQDLDLPIEFHVNNRKALRAKMPENSVAIFFAAPIQKKSHDISYAYHPDPNFYYLTGYKESHSVLMVFKTPLKIDSILVDELIFVQENNPNDEIWDGARLGVNGVKEQLKFKYVISNKEFSVLNLNYEDFDLVLTHIPAHGFEDNARDPGDLASMHKHLLLDLKTDSVLVNEQYRLKDILAGLRQFKSSREIELIREACIISAKAQNELMRTFKSGMYEYQAQAFLEFVFVNEGAEKRAFPSICGSGENGCVLHYSENRRQTKSGDLMLVDIGAEYKGYASDMTRTFPVNGKFSPSQKLIYNLVLKAQKEAIKLCKVGQKFWTPHDKAIKVLAAGMMQLGIISSYKDVYRYYMHGTNHYVGLDVHDAGLYGAYKPNQVVAIEPGIYIPSGSPCAEKWWGIGIRIEDNILITKYGNEVLTKDTPVSVEDIEALMKEESKYFK